MNEQKISPEDPKLTAYALGELGGEECAAFERLLKDDPAAQAVINDVRALAGQLETVLAQEAAADAARLGQTVVEGSKADRPAQGSTPFPPAETDRYRKKVIRFPYVLIGSLAAACFAVMVAIHEKGQPIAHQEVNRAEKVAAEESNASAAASALSEREQAKVLAGKPAGTFSAPMSVGATADTSANSAVPMFLVKDAHEAARIPVVALPDDKTSATPSVASDRLPEIDAFAVAQEPIKADLSLGAGTSRPSIAASVAGAVQPQIESGNVGATGRIVMNEHVAPAPVASSLMQESTAGQSPSGEVIVLNAFTVESSREGSIGSMSMAGGSRKRAILSKGAKESATMPSAWGQTGTSFGDVRMNFRAKSTTPMANTESYSFMPENDFFRVRNSPLSTFSADVDTASYANVRRFLDHGQRPPRDAIRVEEMVNYFNYRYEPPPKDVKEPFAASMEIAAAPWNPAHRLVRIGLKGREIATEDRPAANLVFLLDVSGSMSSENKLPLVKESLRMLVEKLRPDDRVAIVTYAGASGLALPSTPVAKKREILAALDELSPGGSTNGAMGIQLAYDIAKANLIEGGANRVILCTDGDFNVGVTGDGDLTRLIEEKAKSGVFLTVLGFGMGNLKDGTLERLADKGNGNYGYIDSRAEAHKLLVEQAGGTLVTIAKDVKLQVEFNPAVAQAYRLIGYENRALKKEDFNNDKVDAGEIGSGHSVTALYEIVPVGAPAPDAAPEVDALKYQSTGADTTALAATSQERDTAKPVAALAANAELLTLKIRFKEPTVDVSRKIEIPAIDTGAAFEAASKDFKFAAAVASLGMILRESEHKGTSDYDRVISWAEAGKGDDADGRRGEFIELVKKARALSAE